MKTPSDGFKWNQLGELYQWFTDTYAHLSLKELMGMLDDNIQKIFTMIDSMTEEELFLPHKRKCEFRFDPFFCLFPLFF